jgi:hypothetical protein
MCTVFVRIPHRDRDALKMAVERRRAVQHERAKLSMINRKQTSAMGYTVDVDIARQMRELLERMCKLATYIRVGLDELTLAKEDGQGKGDLVKLAEDFQERLDVRRPELRLLAYMQHMRCLFDRT